MITDTMLNNTAAFMNGESPRVISHLTTSSEQLVLSGAETVLATEYFPRIATSSSRVNNKTTFSATKTGTGVPASGIFINSMALTDSSTGGFINVVATFSSILQTSAFDIQTDWIITASRS